VKARVVGGQDISILPKICKALGPEGKKFCSQILLKRRSDQYKNSLTGFVCCAQQMKSMSSAILHPTPPGDHRIIES